MSLESRLGITPRQQDRTVVEEAPQRIRLFLRDHLTDGYGRKGALTIMGAEADVDTSDYTSPSWVAGELDRVMAQLDWLSVYRLLEEHAPSGQRQLAEYDQQVNELLARTRVAYEMVGGHLQRLDQTGATFDVAGEEHRALDVMTGKFRPARDQYRLAVQALDSVPVRPKEAVRESVNALEAVLKIITQQDRGTLGQVIGDVVRDPHLPWRTTLGSALGSLYGYSSQVPGSRHGQYIDAEVSTAEAALVVRICGAAIVYFIDQHGS